jgi:hypothetical protein
MAEFLVAAVLVTVVRDHFEKRRLRRLGATSNGILRNSSVPSVTMNPRWTDPVQSNEEAWDLSANKEGDRDEKPDAFEFQDVGIQRGGEDDVRESDDDESIYTTSEGGRDDGSEASEFEPAALQQGGKADIQRAADQQDDQPISAASDGEATELPGESLDGNSFVDAPSEDGSFVLDDGSDGDDDDGTQQDGTSLYMGGQSFGGGGDGEFQFDIYQGDDENASRDEGVGIKPPAPFAVPTAFQQAVSGNPPGPFQTATNNSFTSRTSPPAIVGVPTAFQQAVQGGGANENLSPTPQPARLSSDRSSG